MTLKEFYKRATAKNMKSMRGHDGPAHGWDRSNYDIIGYKKSILDMLTLNKDYRFEYEKIYTEEGHCKGDNKVVNWQYLEGCDIKVPEQYRWNKVDYVNRIMKRQ